VKVEFKRVPALDKCFSILDFFARKKEPSGITEISSALNIHKSTVFNIVHTLTDLGVLENNSNKFRFGAKLYLLGKAAEKGSELIRNIHPYLEEISQKTNLSSFLGMRAGLKAVILDKAESDFDIKISSEIGTQIPLIAGAHGKALLSQLSDAKIDEILSQTTLRRFTRYSCVDKKKYRKMINEVRKEGISVEKEEYIEDIMALAVPLNINREDLQVAIWAVGLKSQFKDGVISKYSSFMKEIAEKIENQFSFRKMCRLDESAL
jgi:IclR family KDG regulon transcriptional repressor